jgi:putative flippase GtrA
MNTVSALSPLLVKFLRFALVGLVGTAAHFMMLTALVELAGLPVVLATTMGFCVGALVNYTLNHRFTFASTEKHTVALPKFLTISAASAVFNALIVAWLLHHVPVHYLIIQMVSTGTVLLWNFGANYLWTFRTQTP